MSKSPLASLLVVSCAIAVLFGCNDKLPTRFPHAKHLSEIACGGPGQPDCLSCATCHEIKPKGVPTIPKADVCRRCHDASDTEELAAANPSDDIFTQKARSITFEHERHLKQKAIKGQCVPCHAGAVKPALDADRFPPMSKCFECHEHQSQWDRGVCAPCHQRSDLLRLMPQTFLRHDATFQKKHGQQARQSQKICQQCHSQSQCDDCHDVTQDLTVERRRPDAIERSFVHRGDFVARHSIEARSQPARCARCHTPRDCEGCHLERGVSGTHRAGLNPHPPGWVGSDPNAQSFHGRDARRDIVACATCHDQGPATNCIRCHKVGGFGGNPHPKGWKSARSDSASMCRYCHGS